MHNAALYVTFSYVKRISYKKYKYRILVITDIHQGEADPLENPGQTFIGTREVHHGLLTFKNVNSTAQAEKILLNLSSLPLSI